MHQELLAWEHHSSHTPDNLWILVKPTTSPKLTAKSQFICRKPKQHNGTNRYNSTSRATSKTVKLSIHKRQIHQVNKVQVVTPQPSTTWDLNTTAKLPPKQEEELE